METHRPIIELIGRQLRLRFSVHVRLIFASRQSQSSRRPLHPTRPIQMIMMMTIIITKKRERERRAGPVESFESNVTHHDFLARPTKNNPSLSPVVVVKTRPVVPSHFPFASFLFPLISLLFLRSRPSVFSLFLFVRSAPSRNDKTLQCCYNFSLSLRARVVALPGVLVVSALSALTTHKKRTDTQCARLKKGLWPAAVVERLRKAQGSPLLT